MKKKAAQKLRKKYEQAYKSIREIQIKGVALGSSNSTDRNPTNLGGSEVYANSVFNQLKSIKLVTSIINYKTANEDIITQQMQEELKYDLYNSTGNEFEETLDFYFNPNTGIVIKRLKSERRLVGSQKLTQEEKEIFKKMIK